MSEDLKNRSELLYSLGFKFDGEQFNFTNEKIKAHFHMTDLKCMGDSEFNSVLEKIKTYM